MGKHEDSLTIARGCLVIRDLLSDLRRHPSFVPDGFKHYRYLSLRTAGVGARAAVLVNLLGRWLNAELAVTEATQSRVVLHAVTTQVDLELHFELLEKDAHTQVGMSAIYRPRRLPPWRVRTRIKQWLRLGRDVEVLCGRWLPALRQAAETSLDAAMSPEEDGVSVSTSPSLEPRPPTLAGESWEV